jgi:hypothetical protein
VICFEHGLLEFCPAAALDDPAEVVFDWLLFLNLLQKLAQMLDVLDCVGSEITHCHLHLFNSLELIAVPLTGSGLLRHNFVPNIQHAH